MEDRDLAAWYAPRAAAYPWRGERDPYRVLVSEVMLQQTQAARVAPAYGRFVARFPDVRALAGASKADVLREWSGLGYYRRGVALSAAARMIVRDHGGDVPSDRAALLALPGVGPYTADAVAALAFGAPVPALDTNVRRVVARVRLGCAPDAVPAGELAAAAREWLAGNDPRTWNQAVMDLGRELCRPRPRCDACPLRACRSRSVAARPSARRQPAFAGSLRQRRGMLVGALVDGGRTTLASLSRTTGMTPQQVTEAATALARDGVVEVGGREGSPGAWARLVEDG